MTTTTPATLRPTGPADLLTAVPYLLGFHPLESLILVGFEGRRLVVTARVDLTDATPTIVAETLGTLRRSGATAVTAAIITDQVIAVGEVESCVTDAADWSGLLLQDLLLVTGGRWRSLRCTDKDCCPPDGRALPTTPTAVDAAAVHAGLTALPGREALAAMFTPDPGRPDLAGELHHHRQVHERAERDGTLPAWERSAVRALLAAQRAAQAGRMPTDNAAARFGVALRSYPVRDAVWLAIDDGRLDGIELWVNLARRLPHPHDAGPLFLAGWHAYRQGNGAMAGIATDLATTADPGYSAAGLLRQALACRIDPRRLPLLSVLPPGEPEVTD